MSGDVNVSQWRLTGWLREKRVKIIYGCLTCWHSSVGIKRRTDAGAGHRKALDFACRCWSLAENSCTCKWLCRRTFFVLPLGSGAFSLQPIRVAISPRIRHLLDFSFVLFFFDGFSTIATVVADLLVTGGRLSLCWRLLCRLICYRLPAALVPADNIFHLLSDDRFHLKQTMVHVWLNGQLSVGIDQPESWWLLCCCSGPEEEK